MRKASLILAAVCLAAGITACGSSDTQSTTAAGAAQTEASQEIEEEAVEEKETDSSAGEETEDEDAEKTVTGRVDEITDGTVLSISGQNDIAYQIDIADAETDGTLEVGEGDQIQITFVDSDEEIKSAVFYDILTSAELEGDMDPILSGVVADVAEDTIFVEAESGNTYSFSIAIAQLVTGGDGIVAGESVDVTYYGELPAADEEGLALRVITEEASGSAGATYKTLSGTIASIDEDTLVLEAGDGTQFTFAVAGAADPEEYRTGEAVTVTYHGSLTNGNAEVEEVESDEEFNEDEEDDEDDADE